MSALGTRPYLSPLGSSTRTRHLDPVPGNDATWDLPLAFATVTPHWDLPLGFVTRSRHLDSVPVGFANATCPYLSLLELVIDLRWQESLFAIDMFMYNHLPRPILLLICCLTHSGMLTAFRNDPLELLTHVKATCNIIVVHNCEHEPSQMVPCEEVWP